MKRIIVFLLLFVPLVSNASFDSNLYYGLRNNNDVKELQKFLADEGFYTGPITGQFFSLTLKAVKDFQEKKKISPVSGFFGPATRKIANEILTGRLALPDLPPVEPAKNSDDVIKYLQDQTALFLQQINLLESKKIITNASNSEPFKLQQKIEILHSEINNLNSLIKSMEDKEEVSAGAYIVMDAQSKKVVLERNIDQQYPIASVTKLMNAVIALENIAPKTIIKLTEGMLRPEGKSPSLFLSSKISVENLLKASLIQSVNDSSQALSDTVGVGRFVDLMNKKAKELGMENTIYYDSHGLSEKNISTVNDLAKLADYIHQKFPQVLEMTRNNDFWLPDARGRLLKFKNLNNFYAMPHFMGGKTGYTIKSKETMVSMFNINNKPIIIAVLYSENSQTDILKLIDMAKYI